MTSIPDKPKKSSLVSELLSSVSEQDRCEHLRVDEIGPYCVKDFEQGMITEQRRDICDTYSLQLWCLDKKRCVKCIWYQGEPFF